MSAKQSNPSHYDVIVIGGGPNGLVAAATLARAGRKVLVLERSLTMGSVMTTTEITPGYHASAGAALLEGLSPALEKRLRLKKHGLRFATYGFETIALERDGRNLTLPSGRAPLVGVSSADTRAYAMFQSQQAACAYLLGSMQDMRLTDGSVEALRKLVWRIAGTRGIAMGDIMQQLPARLGDVLDATFESPLLKGALALDALLGQGDGPYEPGTMLRLWQRLSLRQKHAGPRLPIGGMSAFSEALCASIVAQGGEIRAGIGVRKLLLTAGVISGVETDQDQRFTSNSVLSCIDPVTTLLDLLGAVHLDAGLTRHIASRKVQGVTAKINLALEGLPVVKGLAPERLGNRLLAVASLEELDQASLAFRRRELHSDPVMEIHLPSLADPSLAPEGQHVMSVLVQYVPQDLATGWQGGREKLVQNVVRSLTTYMPDLPNRIIAGTVMTPPDIEKKYGLKGGDWHHGVVTIDRLLQLGPTDKMAPHHTPIAGLYLGGAGSFVGNACGEAGHRAARLLLEERGR